ncbi:hypothetical protein F2Q69_00025907 [Brassica cretica]|uniref:Uncharacterized protein n=1 Tax=Brassica cretica TaxID=69181 RepID=A0A8S9RWF9_BRACR|nr:hypothetical protein F2Q69_00025907 [Brassica cretica]
MFVESRGVDSFHLFIILCALLWYWLNRFPNAYLLVGCCNDDTSHKYKGETVIKHTKYVNQKNAKDTTYNIGSVIISNHSFLLAISFCLESVLSADVVY